VTSAERNVDLVICIFSVALAILTGLQQLLDYIGRAQRHSAAAADLAEIERKWTLGIDFGASPAQVVNLQKELSARIKTAPHVSQSLQAKAHALIQDEIAKARAAGQQQTQQQQQG